MTSFISCLSIPSICWLPPDVLSIAQTSPVDSCNQLSYLTSLLELGGQLRLHRELPKGVLTFSSQIFPNQSPHLSQKLQHLTSGSSQKTEKFLPFLHAHHEVHPQIHSFYLRSNLLLFVSTIPPWSKPTPFPTWATTTLWTSCFCPFLFSLLLSPQPVWASVPTLLRPFNGFPLLLEQNTRISPWPGTTSAWPTFPNSPCPSLLLSLASLLFLTAGSPPAGLCLPPALHSTDSFLFSGLSSNVTSLERFPCLVHLSKVF